MPNNNINRRVVLFPSLIDTRSLLDIPGPILMVDHKNVSEAVGQPVPSWEDPDVSGFTFANAVGGEQPIKKANYVEFDGVDDILYTTSLISPAVGTVIWVELMQQGVGFSEVIATSQTNDVQRIFGVGHTQNNKMYVRSNRTGDAQYNQQYGPTVLPDDEFYIGICTADAATWKLYLNGVEETPVIGNGSNTGDFFKDATDTGADRLSMGGWFRTAGNIHRKVKLGVVCVWDRILTAEEQTYAVDLLKAEYGIS